MRYGDCCVLIQIEVAGVMALTPFLFLLSAVYRCHLQVCTVMQEKSQKEVEKCFLECVEIPKFLWG